MAAKILQKEWANHAFPTLPSKSGRSYHGLLQITLFWRPISEKTYSEIPQICKVLIKKKHSILLEYKRFFEFIELINFIRPLSSYISMEITAWSGSMQSSEAWCCHFLTGANSENFTFGKTAFLLFLLNSLIITRLCSARHVFLNIRQTSLKMSLWVTLLVTHK